MHGVCMAYACVCMVRMHGVCLHGGGQPQHEARRVVTGRAWLGSGLVRVRVRAGDKASARVGAKVQAKAAGLGLRLRG